MVVAPPAFSTKLACLAEKRASPKARSETPAASSSSQALWPGGFLKVEPNVLIPFGCASQRRLRSVASAARTAAGGAGVSAKRALATISPAARAELR